MNEDFPKVRLVLDTRSPKNNPLDRTKSLYPVKIYVYDSLTRVNNRYGTTFSFTKEEFESIWLAVKPRKHYQEIRSKLQALLEKSISDAESIIPFTFAEFEKTLNRHSQDKNNVFWHYQELINSKTGIDSISNLELYKNSSKSVKVFLGSLDPLKEKKIDFLPFEIVTVDWLKKYEAFMDKAGKSKTTTGMYLKPLQAVFNAAGIKNDNPRYPFGVGKFRIKEVKKSNKALSDKELKKLLAADPVSEDQQKAKCFFFFSYFSNGMNVKDILLLRYGQIKDDEFSFFRSKTKSTGAIHKEINVCLNEFTKMVIQEYGNDPNGNPKQFVFKELTEQDSEEYRHKRIKAFTRYINQHIKKLATSIGITGDISTYFARHSYATGMIRDGQPIAFLQEALGHSASGTTQKYIAGFTDKSRKEAAEGLYHKLIS